MDLRPYVLDLVPPTGRWGWIAIANGEASAGNRRVAQYQPAFAFGGPDASTCGHAPLVVVERAVYSQVEAREWMRKEGLGMTGITHAPDMYVARAAFGAPDAKGVRRASDIGTAWKSGDMLVFNVESFDAKGAPSKVRSAYHKVPLAGDAPLGSRFLDFVLEMYPAAAGTDAPEVINPGLMRTWFQTRSAARDSATSSAAAAAAGPTTTTNVAPRSAGPTAPVASAASAPAAAARDVSRQT